MHRSPALFLTALLVAGCTPDDNYPSLLPRGIEEAPFAQPEAPPPESVAPDPALDDRIAGLIRTLDEAAASFAARAADTRAAFAASGARSEGSAAWFRAQEALGATGAAHDRALVALSALESLQIARAQEAAPIYPELAAAIAAGRTEIDRQSESLHALLRMAP